MLEALATGLGGVGVFFAGMYLLTENLKKLTGHRFRATVAAWTRNPAAAFLWGIAAGAVMQSTTAVTFVLVSMIATGLIGVRAAMVVLLGCNVGTTFLVLFATLDIHLFVLFTLGIAGVAFAHDRFAPVRTFASALFGIGLFFLGLQMLQSGAAPLAREPWVEEVMRLAGASYFLPFVFAAVITMGVQSSNSVTLLAITLAGAGVFTFEQTVMAIYGSNVGSSMLSLLLSAHLRGRQMQVARYRAAFNFVAAAVMVPLFYVEIYTGLPIVRGIVESLASGFAVQMAYVHVVFNVVGALVLLPFIGTAAKILARRFPTPPEEDDRRPAYLYHQALQEPLTALDLAAAEQARLAGYLPRYLSAARQASHGTLSALSRQHETFKTLGGEIQSFLDQLGEAPLPHTGYERLNATISTQRLLDALSDTLEELARTAAAADDNPLVRQLIGNVVEGLDAVLLTLADAMAGPDLEEDRMLLRQMTGDRSRLMQRLREAYLMRDSDLRTPQKALILSATNLAERASWLLDRIALSFPEPLPKELPASREAVA